MAAPGPDANAIAKAHAICTPAIFYDLVVHGLSNPLAWGCPTRRLVELYRANLSANHLEAGIGTGFFLDRVNGAKFDRLVLLDINENCLGRASRRLARFSPSVCQANLLARIPKKKERFDSVGLTYVLHCLPGRMSEKLSAVDHLKPLMHPRAVLFGATILGRGISPNVTARKLLDLYNANGMFNNREDDFESLSEGLRRRFGEVELERQGCVALFRAVVRAD